MTTHVVLTSLFSLRNNLTDCMQVEAKSES